MSSNLPPTPPPAGPPGPPPEPPEFLDSAAGGPLPPAAPAPSGRGRRKAVLVGGGVVGLAAVGAGAFAAYNLYFATGPQPAEALPASTIGYVSVDLDPSGKQKLAALEALEKFPAFNENVDIDSDDDLREKFFEMVQDEGACADLEFADDIEPWLGDRFGFAAVDLGKENDEGVAEPTPVGVVQIDDADAAEEGLQALVDCGSGSGSGEAYGSSDGYEGSVEPEAEESEEAEEMGGWSIQGDWVVIAETTELAEEVTDAAADDPLSDDEDFEKWTEAAGDAGILTAYAAPEAGQFLADAFGSFPMGGHSYCAAVPDPIEPPDTTTPDLGTEDGFDDDPYGDPYDDPYDDPSCDSEVESPDTEQLQQLFEDFDGAALTVRFDDGGLEVESASSVDFLGLDKVYGSDRGDDVVATLPADTAAALGVGFEEGWFDELTTYLDEVGGGAFDIDEGLAMLEEETGLSLPEDAEILAGESAAIVLGPDFEAADFESDDPSDVPLGIKVKGDEDAITGVIDKLLASADAPPEVKDEFSYQTGDGYVVAGFSPEFTEQLLDDGELGDTDVYQDVVEESEDAASVLFVNFDAGDWLTEVAAEDPELQENLEPLKALGMSAWTDDGVSHSVLRITTD